MMYAVIKKVGDDQRALEYSTHATREDAQREADATGGTVHSITDMEMGGHAFYLDAQSASPVRSEQVEKVKRDCRWIVATKVKDGRITKFLPFETEDDAKKHAKGKWPVIDTGGTGIADLVVEVNGTISISPVSVDHDTLDHEALNAALTAEGSVLRAVVELLLDRDTQMTEAVANATSLANLRASFPKPVPRKQFVQALKRKMR